MTTSPNAEKAAVVSEVREKLAAADAALITEYRGMTVGSLAKLRRSLSPLGAEYKVYKNTLASRAAQEAGFEGLSDFLVGPTAITFVKGRIGSRKSTSRPCSNQPTVGVEGWRHWRKDR